MSDKVVYLAFKSDNLNNQDGREMLSCSACRNKTYIARCDLGEWNVLQCAACDAQIGKIGWAE